MRKLILQFYQDRCVDSRSPTDISSRIERWRNRHLYQLSEPLASVGSLLLGQFVVRRRGANARDHGLHEIPPLDQRNRGDGFLSSRRVQIANSAVRDRVPAVYTQRGNTIERLHAKSGYRGHNAPSEYKFKVYTSSKSPCF
jgi:hypothetical protein